MKNTNALNQDKKAAPGALAVLGLLFLLPPLLFWLTVALKVGGGSDWIFRFWGYLPGFSLGVIIILLPIPSLILGVFAFRRIRKQGAKGIALSLMTIALSVLFVVLCTLAVFRP